ncbi:c-type cytochrome [Arcobacter arenosus]|jgi:cytochrome c553|uniref:C-type cytochrome n=1 Tax=Arcobacter arenosus TaxID=2576037 RepID=A0A5R8Y415_9BACT|nr:c-type cytochrome [Arcobacter arenosus]TLP40854.1 c-type cytochrome [Arcobacter arenosus]
MKKVIALISTAIVLGLMVLTFFKGPAYQGGKAGHIIEDLKALEQKAKIEPIKEKDVGAEKLKALRDKAGNTSSFEVSDAYKSKCASCHGVDGSGTQNGKKLMGPGLIGQSEDKLLKDLVDFKAGRKENFIMKGLLMNLSEEDLKSFAKEISQFEARKNALK